ncbi:hypothetical protein [Pseudomonas sp. PI1]|uniref:hypothetical protein n=1 Tax=Pseudomonas sp. PI1 TaxID=1582493 RepID=UPI001269A6AA|nr:hypothetical protein [Pseudomonas sp. PI1]
MVANTQQLVWRPDQHMKPVCLRCANDTLRLLYTDDYGRVDPNSRAISGPREGRLNEFEAFTGLTLADAY